MKKFGIFVLLGCMLFSGCGNKDSSENQSNVEMTPAVTQAVTTPAPASSDPGSAGERQKEHFYSRQKIQEFLRLWAL